MNCTGGCEMNLNSKRNAILDLVRIIGMILVMLIHSPGDENMKSAPGIFFLRYFIASGAVPVFFMLSGYLGARKIDSASVSIMQYLREKCRTLISPFLFWNTTVLLLVFSAKYMGLDSSFRGAGQYFDVNLTFSSIATALLGIGRLPIVYQFWFLRDLIVVVILVFILRRYVPGIPLLPWLVFFIPLPIASSLGYYLIGHQLHSILPTTQFPSCRSSTLYCACWLLMGAGVISGIVAIPYPFQQIGSAAFIFMLAIIVSTASFATRLSALGSSVFFVYATHEPLQTIIGKLWQAHQFPAFGSPFCFLIIPAIVFPSCLFACWIMRRMFPRFMLFATGGR
jgi:surface polysaccharide O-acyltransferase-like enzyme